MLSFQTAPLSDDVVIAGAISAHLFASTTGSDADWIVKLIDVYPEAQASGASEPDDSTRRSLSGYELMVANDVLRGRFRNGFVHPEAIVPNQVAEYTVDLHTQDYRFLKGHRIMVQVQSSWFSLLGRRLGFKTYVVASTIIGALALAACTKANQKLGELSQEHYQSSLRRRLHLRSPDERSRLALIHGPKWLRRWPPRQSHTRRTAKTRAHGTTDLRAPAVLAQVLCRGDNSVRIAYSVVRSANISACCQLGISGTAGRLPFRSVLQAQRCEYYVRQDGRMEARR